MSKRNTENRYSNAKVYKLCSNVDEKFYIGSTCDELAKKKFQLKNDAKKNPGRRVNRHFAKIGWENACLILVETVKCANIHELNRRTRELIEEMKPELNKNLPSRPKAESDKHYREENKEKLQEQAKEYYETHKEILNAKTICECGGRYSKNAESKHFKTQMHIDHFGVVEKVKKVKKKSPFQQIKVSQMGNLFDI